MPYSEGRCKRKCSEGKLSEYVLSELHLSLPTNTQKQYFSLNDFKGVLFDINWGKTDDCQSTSHMFWQTVSLMMFFPFFCECWFAVISWWIILNLLYLYWKQCGFMQTWALSWQCMPIRAGYTIRNERGTQQFKFGVISHITSLKRGDPAGYKSIEHEG